MTSLTVSKAAVTIEPDDVINKLMVATTTGFDDVTNASKVAPPTQSDGVANKLTVSTTTGRADVIAVPQTAITRTQ